MQEFRTTVKSWPTITDSIPDQLLRAGSETAIPLWKYFADPDGDELAYSATSGDSNSVRVSVRDSTLTIKAAEDISATATITASAADSLARATQTFRTRVTRPPTVADSIPDHTLRADRSATIHLGEYFADPDSDALVYSATSEEPRVVGVSIRDSTLTIIAGHIPAATVITVSAADEHGPATQDFETVVRPPPAVWREDFDSTLTGWDVDKRVNGSSAKVEDGSLRIDLSSPSAYVVVTKDTAVVDIADDWTITVSTGVRDTLFCTSFAAMTGDTITRGWMFDIYWNFQRWGMAYSHVEEGDYWDWWQPDTIGGMSLPKIGGFGTFSIYVGGRYDHTGR